MNKVLQLEAELGKLSSAELRQIRDWRDALLEDDLEFTAEFEAQIRTPKLTWLRAKPAKRGGKTPARERSASSLRE